MIGDDNSDFDPDAFNSFERTGWERAATHYHDQIGGLTAQSADSLLDAAGVAIGSHVLDIATGPGYVAGRAHARGAHAAGVDIAENQLKVARKVYPGVEFKTGDGENLDFADASFDGVVCGFGLLHFGRPERAMQEAGRVLKPGGKVAFTVWAAPDVNPGMAIIFGALSQHADMTVPLPEGPHMFRFSDPGECQRLFEGAGLVDAEVTSVPQTWRGASPDGLYDIFSRAAVRSTALIQAQTEDVQATVKQAMRDRVTEHAKGDGYEVPMPAVLASARKPGG